MSARKPALIFIFLTLLIDVLGFGLLIPVSPRLVEQLQGKGEGEAATVYAWLAALYPAMQFLFAPVLGSLSDHFGRRPVLLISMLGSGIDYFAMALAPNLSWLFVTRAINGISGASFSAANAYVADITPFEKRAAGFGMMGAAFGLGFVLGPFAGGVLGEHNIRWPFYAAGTLCIINAPYGLFVLPESLAPENRRAFTWKLANPIGSLSRLTKYPIAAGMGAMFFFLNLAQLGLHATWVLYTKHRYHWSPRAVGISLAIVGVASAIVQGGLARRIVPKLGEGKSLLIGLFLGVLAFTGYGLATQGWMIYAIIAFASIGGIAQPAAMAILTKDIPANEQGGIQGAQTTIQSIAGILGPLIAGNMFAYFISPKAPIYLPGASFLLGAVLTLVGVFIAIYVLRMHSKIAANKPAQAPSQPTPPRG